MVRPAIHKVALGRPATGDLAISGRLDRCSIHGMMSQSDLPFAESGYTSTTKPYQYDCFQPILSNDAGELSTYQWPIAQTFACLSLVSFTQTFFKLSSSKSPNTSQAILLHFSSILPAPVKLSLSSPCTRLNAFMISSHAFSDLWARPNCLASGCRATSVRISKSVRRPRASQLGTTISAETRGNVRLG